MSVQSNSTSPSPQPDQAPGPIQTQTQAQTQIQNQAQNTVQQAPKRSSRRANTAERRATHNAVERARRETLNGRFLDLAGMLPNLAAVRRPSKSAIVNSSIALIHNQQRSRIIAARELRILNAETNALRQEVNEWRSRNSLPRVDEPIRSGDFATLMAVEDVEMGEEMVLGRRSFDDEDEFGEDGEDGVEMVSPETAHPYVGFGLQRAPMQYQQQQAQIVAQQQQQQQLFEQQKAAMARAQQAQAQMQAHAQAQVQAQSRYSPTQQSVMHHKHTQSQPSNVFADAMFSADLYPSGQQQHGQQQSWSQKAIASATAAAAAASTLATPPGSAHGRKQSPYTANNNTAFLSTGGMFQSGYNNSEDDQSDGSSHYSGIDTSMSGNNGLDQPFSFGLSSNVGNVGNFGYGMNMGIQVPTVNMYPSMSMPMPTVHVEMPVSVQMPPSPSHTGSPANSNPQSRRPSVIIPSHGHGHGSNKDTPSPVSMSAQMYGMGLMI